MESLSLYTVILAQGVGLDLRRNRFALLLIPMLGVRFLAKRPYDLIYGGWEHCRTLVEVKVKLARSRMPSVPAMAGIEAFKRLYVAGGPPLHDTTNANVSS